MKFDIKDQTKKYWDALNGKTLKKRLLYCILCCIWNNKNNN